MKLILAQELVARVFLFDATLGNLRGTIATLMGNLFTVVIGFAAIVALVRRRFVLVLELAALAIVVASFVYVPEMWQAVGTAVAKMIQGS